MAARLAAQQIETAVRGWRGLLLLAMHRRAAAAFGVFVRRQIRDVFLIRVRILCFAHFDWVSFWFCSQAAQRIWTAVRRWRALLVGFLGALHAFLRSTVAALGIFLRLEVTYFALIFLFFVFFAHITFQFVSCFFGFGLCQSRRNICPRPRPSRLGSGRPNGSAYLSNASAVELHAPQNLRPFFPSTNSRVPYYHHPCHEVFGPDFFRNSQFLINI